MPLISTAASDACRETAAVGWRGDAGVRMTGFGAAEPLGGLSRKGRQHLGQHLGWKQHFLMARAARGQTWSSGHGQRSPRRSVPGTLTAQTGARGRERPCHLPCLTCTGPGGSARPREGSTTEADHPGGCGPCHVPAGRRGHLGPRDRDTRAAPSPKSPVRKPQGSSRSRANASCRGLGGHSGAGP